WLHATGVGSASQQESTYDAMTLWAPSSGDTLLRNSAVGTATTPELTGGFVPRPDHTAVWGAVYRVDATGKRIGTVGCAQIFLDDLPSPASTADQRYILGVLPTTIDRQVRTERSGRWFFGNIKPGRHTFKVSVDNGQTFIAEKTVYVPLARENALSEYKAIMVNMGIDVPGPDPTPADCPADF
ncbi:MAG TPA: hypothetical protein VFZ61_34975, partial [Polyangiales bacterium]